MLAANKYAITPMVVSSKLFGPWRDVRERVPAYASMRVSGASGDGRRVCRGAGFGEVGEEAGDLLRDAFRPLGR